MPRGYFTIEEWKPPRWVPVLHLDASQTATKAIAALQKCGQTGLFRVVQTQRILWGEMEDGKLRLHGSHTSSPENLAALVELYEREGGRRPVEKARRDRLRAKAGRVQK